MKYLLIPCLFFILGCPATIPIIGTATSAGVIANKATDVMLTRESLKIKREELKLKREIFEETKKR